MRPGRTRAGTSVAALAFVAVVPMLTRVAAAQDVAANPFDEGADETAPALPEPAEPPPPSSDADAEPAPVEPTPEPITSERDAPNYDGREPAPTTSEQVVAWIPRVLFLPAWVGFELLLRRPIEWAITEIERSNILALLFDFFTWEERKAGVVPTFFFDFGFSPSAGLYFFWNDFLVKNNDVRVWGGFWGFDWIHVSVLDRIHIDPGRTTLHMMADVLRRPDQIFNGIGSNIDAENGRMRYSMTSIEGYARLEHDFWKESRLTIDVGIQRYRFGDTDYGTDLRDPEEDQPSVPRAIDQGLLAEYPTAFETGYTAVRQRILLAIDSRDPRPSSGSGFRIQTYGELGWNAENIIDHRWVKYGATIGGFVDVGLNHNIGLSIGTQLVDPIGNLRGLDGIPFEELVDLNDFTHVITGFLTGTLRGQSAAGINLAYTYPIWVWLDGMVHVSASNVFGEHLEDFELDKLRLSFGVGIRTINERDAAFNLEVAFGLDTFEQGGGLANVRIAFGVVGF